MQLHHIDDDPANSVLENLAVLCTDCHNQTLLRGGFDRKLEAAQVRVYKADWIERVSRRRDSEQGPARLAPSGGNQILRYFQTRDEGGGLPYSFSADYVLVESNDKAADLATNVRIDLFINEQLQEVRARGKRTAEVLKGAPGDIRPTLADFSSITHRVSLFTDKVLSVEFFVGFYCAGAAHPNSFTRTFNFGLHPSVELDLSSIFDRSSDYLELLSRYCRDDLLRQKAQRGSEISVRPEDSSVVEDDWLRQGTAPVGRNFERISLRRHGVAVHFDPYHVECYAAGRFEVFIPSYKLASVVRKEVAELLEWR